MDHAVGTAEREYLEKHQITDLLQVANVHGLVVLPCHLLCHEEHNSIFLSLKYHFEIVPACSCEYRVYC